MKIYLLSKFDQVFQASSSKELRVPHNISHPRQSDDSSCGGLPRGL